MKTVVKACDPESPCPEVIAQAAEVIQSGGLVAFPTETVYGLGADAFNDAAAGKIYEAKGRQSDNPLIVHICDRDQLQSICDDIPLAANLLAEKLWPGPLTIILKSNGRVSKNVTRGLNTVAVRYPVNKIAVDLIRRSGTLIAAPSANASGKPSTTKASHVLFDMDGKIDMIIDGGQTTFGLESTILDLSRDTPCLLRPGSISVQEIESIIGKIKIDGHVSASEKETADFVPKAPGMKYTHYSPDADVVLVTGELEKIPGKINELICGMENAGVLATEQTKDLYDSKKYTVLVVGDRNSPETIAANLFKILRRFDYLGVKKVFAEGILEDSTGLAIMNRLKKAAGFDIIEV